MTFVFNFCTSGSKLDSYVMSLHTEMLFDSCCLGRPSFGCLLMMTSHQVLNPIRLRSAAEKMDKLMNMTTLSPWTLVCCHRLIWWTVFLILCIVCSIIKRYLISNHQSRTVDICIDIAAPELLRFCKVVKKKCYKNSLFYVFEDVLTFFGKTPDGATA